MSLLTPRSPLIVIVLGSFIYALWVYTREVLLAITVAYVSSGILIRIGGVIRRRVYHRHSNPAPEHQVG